MQPRKKGEQGARGVLGWFLAGWPSTAPRRVLVWVCEQGTALCSQEGWGGQVCSAVALGLLGPWVRSCTRHTPKTDWVSASMSASSSTGTFSLHILVRVTPGQQPGWSATAPGWSLAILARWRLLADSPALSRLPVFSPHLSPPA